MTTTTDVAVPATTEVAVPGSATGQVEPRSMTPPAAGGGQAVTPRPHGNVPANLAAESVLDLIGQVMVALNTDLEELGGLIDLLQKTADVLDMHITNVDDLGQLVEAPATTRAGLNAASAIGAYLAQMVGVVRDQAIRVQHCNLEAALALRTVLAVQERQRAIGAGPRLLATAGR